MATKYINSITYGGNEYKVIDDTSGYTTPEIFLVTGTITDSNNLTGTTDKSAQEIYEAFEAGKTPIIKIAVDTSIYIVGHLVSTAYDSGDVPGYQYGAAFVYDSQTNNGLSYADISVMGAGTSGGTFSMYVKQPFVEDGSATIAGSSPISVSGTGKIENEETITISLGSIGNIQNTGALQTSDITIATGDKLVVTDSSDSSKVARASISFDTTNTTDYLRKDGTWQTVSSGGSYTATSPISISSSDVISHDTSGVTAGTYVPAYNSKSSGYYFPTETVDSTGHITSASNTGLFIPLAEGSNQYSQAGFMSYSQYVALNKTLDYMFVHRVGSSSGTPFTINAGSSSTIATIQFSGGGASSTTTDYTGIKILDSTTNHGFYVCGVDAFLYDSANTITTEPVLVDWSCDPPYGSAVQVTVSTADPIPTGYILYFYVLYSTYYTGM